MVLGLMPLKYDVGTFFLKNMILLQLAMKPLYRFQLLQRMTLQFVYRQKLIRPENFSEDKWKKIYYLSNGNGSEMRWLSPFI